MSKQRETFEAWIIDGRNSADLTWDDIRSKYVNWIIDAEWEAWQASRAAALEECLSIAKKQEDAAASLGYAEEGWAFKKVADAVGALKEQS